MIKIITCIFPYLIKPSINYGYVTVNDTPSSHALAQSGGKGDTVVVFDSNFAKVLLVPIRYAGAAGMVIV